MNHDKRTQLIYTIGLSVLVASMLFGLITLRPPQGESYDDTCATLRC